MASLRGNTTLFDGDLASGVASGWAYVGSATDVTLFISVAETVNVTIEVAVGNGQPGLNAVDYADPDGLPSAIMSNRAGGDFVIPVAGVPVAYNLSPFASQYIRIRADGDVTGSASINCVARNSRSLRGHQVLWDDVDVAADDVSAAGFVGSETNAVLFLFAAGAFQVQGAAGSGTAGMNTPPDEGAWGTLYDNFGSHIGFEASGATQAIDLSPFGGSWVRLVATGDVSGVTATLAVTD